MDHQKAMHDDFLLSAGMIAVGLALWTPGGFTLAAFGGALLALRVYHFAQSINEMGALAVSDGTQVREPTVGITLVHILSGFIAILIVIALSATIAVGR